MSANTAAAATAAVAATSPHTIVPVFDPKILGKPVKRKARKRSATGT